MSVSYDARALIGVRLSHRDLFTQKKVKAFEHKFSDTDDVNFDPKTGRPLWRVGDVCRLNSYAGVDLEDFSCVEPSIASLDELYCFHNGSECDGDRQYLIGLFAVEEDDYRSQGSTHFQPLTPGDITRARDLCQKVLEPLGLWKPEQFGIHVMQYVNC